MITRFNIWASLTLVFAGCSGGFQFAEVEGKLTKGGEPLGNVRVEFWPETDGPRSTGVTNDQGVYTLKTEDGQQVGAVVGPHKVVLKDLNMYGTQFLGRKAENMKTLNPGAKPRFGPQYGNATSTPLQQTVNNGDKNTLNMEIQ
jgi:hypothetical protein